MNLVLLVFLMFFSFSVSSETEIDSGLVNALIRVESGGDDDAIGDRNLANKAYGCLQIRQPCVDDVKEKLGLPEMLAQDCLGNRELSIRVFRAYMARYATEKRLGRKPTDEDRARIWNGGPNGWKKESTKKYWQKVKKELESQKAKTALMLYIGRFFYFLISIPTLLFLGFFFVSFYVYFARVPPVGGSVA